MAVLDSADIQLCKQVCSVLNNTFTRKAHRFLVFIGLYGSIFSYQTENTKVRFCVYKTLQILIKMVLLHTNPCLLFILLYNNNMLAYFEAAFVI